MDFKQIIRMGLEEYYEELHRALDGLTPEERRFQPDPGSHHIDFTIWHMARVEDGWIQRFARSIEQVWIRDGWPDKLGIPAADNGVGYSAYQLANLPRFVLDDIMEYYESARKETFEFLEGVSADDLDLCPQPEQRPDYTIGRMFSHIIVEEAQHTGQIAYLRGLQRGLNN